MVLIADTSNLAGSFVEKLHIWVLGGTEPAPTPEFASWVDGVELRSSLAQTPGWFNSGLGQTLTYPHRYQRDLAEEYKTAFLSHGPGQYPAHNSISIELSHAPTEAILEELKGRVLSFAAAREDLTILGFRVVRE